MIVIEDINDLTSQVRLYRATRQLANLEIEERKKAQEALHAANTKTEPALQYHPARYPQPGDGDQRVSLPAG